MRTKLIAGLAGLALVATGTTQAELIITGIIDGPNTGGVPKAVELAVTTDIPDLSIYSITRHSNGSVLPTYTPLAVGSGSASAGDYLYFSTAAGALEFFFDDTITTDIVNGVTLFNGDDVMALTKNGVLHDVYGVIGQDGTNQNWEYEDSWAYRVDGTGPSATFDINHWTVAPPDSLDGRTSKGAGVGVVPFGTYAVPEPSMLALLGVGLACVAARRRRA